MKNKENKSSAVLIVLAIVGAALMGGLFYVSSLLTGFQVPAENISPVLTPLKSFMGWFLLIFFSSLIIWGLGKMSARVSDRWVVSMPVTIFVIVTLMFISLEVVWEKGRTTTVDGKWIRTVKQLDAFNEGEDFEDLAALEAKAAAPAEESIMEPVEEVVLAGEELADAEKLFERKCTRCHAVKAVEVKLREFRKKGETQKVVVDMKAVPNSGISKKDIPALVNYINQTY